MCLPSDMPRDEVCSCSGGPVTKVRYRVSAPSGTGFLNSAAKEVNALLLYQTADLWLMEANGAQRTHLRL